MNHLSLFSGIGGLDLAAEWAGFRTVGFVERDRYCQRVLRRHWPGVPIWDDVCEISAYTASDGLQAADVQRGQGMEKAKPAWHCGIAVDIISGGFPCQPHSVAGKRKASGDSRDLWWECARIAGEFRPRWCVWENVPGLLTSEQGHFFGRVLGDMAALGYVVGWATYGAVDVGAPHRRDRVFIVCHLADAGRNGGESQRAGGVGAVAQSSLQGNGEQRQRVWAAADDRSENVADADDAGSQGRPGDILRERTGERTAGPRSPSRLDGNWGSDAGIRRVAPGVPNRVHRLRALGNAVVPQQAYPLFKAIAEYEGIHP